MDLRDVTLAWAVRRPRAQQQEAALRVKPPERGPTQSAAASERFQAAKAAETAPDTQVTEALSILAAFPVVASRVRQQSACALATLETPF